MKEKVSEELLGHLEELAKLKLAQEERLELRVDIEKVLRYMELLDELELESEEELVSPVEKNLQPREDEVESFQNVEKLRALFPERAGPYIVVPRIYKSE